MSAAAPASVTERTRRRTIPPAVLEAGVVVALILFLTRLAFLHGQSLHGDFVSDAWYISHQASALRDAHAPSLYMNAEIAAFYPIFAFYGGTLFVVTGALSLLTGDPLVAEAIVYAIAFAAAYGGWYWLARMAGVSRWLAHAPGIVYVTAPYVLTNLNVRSDFVESVATAAMPLMVASAISVGRADRLRAGPAAALAAATIAFTGSHNLTLLWGTIVLVLGAIVVVAAVPSARTLIPRRGVLRILAVVVPATAVNAWFLLPDLLYSSDTVIAQQIEDARRLLRAPADVLRPTHLLTPGRPDDGDGAGYTLPVLALAWTLLAAVTHRSRTGTPWPRLIAVLTLGVLALSALMGQAHILADLPSPFPLLQSGGRLDTFALFGICGAMVAALALVGRPPSWLAGLLAATLAIGLVQAAVQIGNVDTSTERPPLSMENMVPFGLGDYASGTAKVLKPPPGYPVERVTHETARGGRAVLTVTARPGSYVLTNLMAPTSMVHVTGAVVAGRWAQPPSAAGWQPRWHLVLEIPADAEGTSHTVVIRAARTTPIVVGEIVSILGLLGLAAIAARLTWQRLGRPGPRGPRPRPRRAAAP